MATRNAGIGNMPAGGAQGVVMAYSWMDHRSGVNGAPRRARHVCVEPVSRFDIAVWTQGAATMPGSARWASSR